MRTTLIFFAVIMLCSSCIKEAPLDPEADIEDFFIDASQLTGKTFIDQANRSIRLFLTTEAYTKGVAPGLKVSGKASVVPASGDSIHFDKGPVTYTITSESRVNSKVYTVEVVNVGSWTFNFENWSSNPENKYEFPIEENQDIIWTSGNPGVALSGVAKEASAYPTRSTNDGYLHTKAAELVTLKGTGLSSLIGIYLYSGSLFIGEFNISAALFNPLGATEFGRPYVGLPDRFVGYYKYTPGAVFQDEMQNPINEKIDECSIYAVLFQGPDRLDASNISNSDRIIAVATLRDGSEKKDFTKFDIPFVYKSGTIPSPPLMMTIVAASSKEGDHYRGSIGSRLVVDSLSIIPK